MTVSYTVLDYQFVLYERGLERVLESSLLSLVADQDTVFACLHSACFGMFCHSFLTVIFSKLLQYST